MSPATDYNALIQQLHELLKTETDPVINMANMSALLFIGLDDVNWAGFYRLVGKQLLLCPFQGRPACPRIQLGQGICGTVAKTRIPLMIEEVSEFPNHVANDPSSRSELALPIIKNDNLIGVLDLSSPTPGHFKDADRTGLENLLEIFVLATDLD